MNLLFKYLRNYRGLLVWAFFLATVDQVFISMNPYILGNILIDPFASKASFFREHGLKTAFFQGILRGVALMMLASTVAFLSKAMQNYMVEKIIRKLSADLYADVQKHVLMLSYQEFEDSRSGEILSLLQKARFDCEQFITKFINVLFVSIIAVIVVSIIAFQISPGIPVFYVLVVAVFSGIVYILTDKYKTIQESILKETTELAGHSTESLRNIEIIKSLGLVVQEIQRLNVLIYSILKRELSKLRAARSLAFLYGGFIQTINQGVIFLLLGFVFYDRMTVGQLLMMQIYFYFIFGTLVELGAVIFSYRETQASMNKLGVLLLKPVEFEPPHPQKIGSIERLHLDRVRFQHASAVVPALEDISINIRVGDTIAVVGPSGAGKTTLIKLLVGLYHATGGGIYYNEILHTDISYEELRAQIGIVTQDTHLFSGTIKDNLLFANPEATDAMMHEILEKVSCSELLARVPLGINTFVGEGGLKLSGGERQRLAIARSLLRPTKLLIFDEATSALDSLTEKQIVSTIRDITATGQFITLMIAHRLSTIMFADRIYVMDKGCILEQGNHDSLLQQNGLYAGMWRQQTGEERDHHFSRSVKLN